MSTAAQLFGAFFILCAIGAIGTLLASKRWSSIVLAAIGSLSAILILLTSALLLVGDTSFRAELWPALLAGNNGIGGGSPFRAVPVDSWVGVSTGVNLLRCLPGPKALQPAVFRRAVSCPVRIGRADPYTNDAISFLVSWEIMSIASYLLVNFEYEHDESSHAGFMMLAMSEAGTISVAIAFTLAAGWRRHLRVRSDTICREGIGWAVFLLSFFGFAVKAGLVPVNSWLPLAHPVAPTNVSALLSAVIVNLGIYGIMRFNLGLRPVTGSEPGLIVLIVGSISAGEVRLGLAGCATSSSARSLGRVFGSPVTSK
jgi:hypothetical protein